MLDLITVMGSTWKRLAAHRTAVFVLYCTVYLATCQRLPVPARSADGNRTVATTTSATSFIFRDDDEDIGRADTAVTGTGLENGTIFDDYFMPEDDCPSMYMCPAPLETKSKVLPNWDQLNCRCDDECTVYGDCCVNAPTFNVTSAKSAGRHWHCVNLVEYQGLYMRASCPADWSDDVVRESCERNNIAEYSVPVTDPLGATPLTSLRSRFTYQNYYCAVCNSDISDNSVFWTPRVECEDLQDYNSTFGNVTDDYVWRNLHYNETNGHWGVTLPDFNRTRHGRYPPSLTSATLDSFVVCRLMVQMPDNVVDLVRRCRPLVTECAASWRDESSADLCHSYTAVAFGGGDPGTYSYRNVHCAICNGERLDTLNCRSNLFYRNVNPSSFAPSFAFLFDINERGGELVGTVNRCQEEGEIFDPFFKVCRQMMCVKTGYRMRNGRCVSESGPSKTTKTTSTTTTLTTTSSTTTTPSTETKRTTAPTKANNTGNEIPTNRTDPEKNPIRTTDDDDDDDGATEPNDIDHEHHHREKPAKVDYNRTQNGKPEGRFGTDNDTATNTTYTELDDNSVDVGSSTIAPITTSTRAPEVDDGRGDDTDCIRFNITRLHYHTYANGSIFIEEYGRVYTPADYVQSYDGSILICMPLADDNLTKYLYSRKFSPILAYLTVAGLGISITCLIFHLLACTVVPFLRNLSGKNLASLCVALLASYVTFIISQFGSAVSKSTCTSVGVVLYYSFLASFFWMNAIAFDVWRSLRLSTSELRVSSGQQWRKFVIYSAYSWFGPAAVVATSIAVENSVSVPAIFRPSFGLVTCWFGNRRALLIFFVAPVITIIVLNGLMFALSAHNIISSTLNSVRHMGGSSGGGQHQLKARRNFRLYLRLALIMGLSWVFGIVAGQVDQEFLWYVFIIFNTLQGLFIFLSFTCTKRVRVYLRDKVFCKKPSYYTSSHGAHPGRKFELEGRDSGSGESQTSQTSQTSRLSLTKTCVTKSASDTLY